MNVKSAKFWKTFNQIASIRKCIIHFHHMYTFCTLEWARCLQQFIIEFWSIDKANPCNPSMIDASIASIDSGIFQKLLSCTTAISLMFGKCFLIVTMHSHTSQMPRFSILLNWNGVFHFQRCQLCQMWDFPLIEFGIFNCQMSNVVGIFENFAFEFFVVPCYICDSDWVDGLNFLW